MKKAVTIFFVFLSLWVFSQNHELFLSNDFSQNNQFFLNNNFKPGDLNSVDSKMSITYSNGDSDLFMEVTLDYSSNGHVSSIFITSNSKDVFDRYMNFCKTKMIEVDPGKFDKGFTSPDYGMAFIFGDIYSISISRY